VEAVQQERIAAKSLQIHEQRTVHYVYLLLQSLQAHHPQLACVDQVIATLQTHVLAKCSQVPTIECCNICNNQLDLDIYLPHVSYCSTCEISIERCCYSYHLFNSCDDDDASVLHACPICHAMVNWSWIVASQSLYAVMFGHSSLLCPYCAVLVLRVS
jgi:hypothetical protein